MAKTTKVPVRITMDKTSGAVTRLRRVKPKKPLAATWYCLCDAENERRYLGAGFFGPFAGCDLYRSRAEANTAATTIPFRLLVVPVRCRPLTSKKRNPKRTR